jgi:signal transduction histidine kinase/ActR/RegA family two-component response regulator
MRFFRRSLIALGVAASLPTIIFAAVATFSFLQAESRRVEGDTLDRAQIITTLIDANLRGDAAALNVLSGSVYFDSKNWGEFYPRVERVRVTNPNWATIALFDVRARLQIFETRKPLGAPQANPLIEAALPELERTHQPVVGNVLRDPEPFIFIFVPVIRGSSLEYVLAVGIRAGAFHQVLMDHSVAGATTAVVDREGRFVDRSIDAEHRVAQPATEYVRNAIHTAKQGIYRGRTYEGLVNYTAYYVSPWSGWSTHIAIPSTLIDTPTSWSFVVAGIAGLGGALLAGVLIVLVLRDMSERRRAEEVLRQSQKMEAVGQLTGGIAHDFNNLLTAIIGNLDLIRTRAVGNDRLQRLADNALEAARRGAKLASQLLAFSRNQRMQLAPVPLEQLLHGMSDLLAQSVGAVVTIRTSIAADADTVLSDANQLELALLNLAVNARDAMPSGGTLEIQSRPASYADVRGLPKRAYVELSVKDNGVGMSEAVRTRAMEPFFTTKPIGQGTGLGLSQVYGIVRESGGLVFIDSTPNEGTTLRLILPAAPKPLAPAEAVDPTPTVPSPTVNAATTILVVDDDRQVRRFMAESLRSLGYAVTDVPSGDVALSVLRNTRFDLLLADFAMPSMNGAELVRQAHEIQPTLRVLIVSGYADSGALDAVLGNAHMLRKPFAVTELNAAVAKALKTSTDMS